MVTDWEDPTKRKELGQRLQQLRETAGITQGDLAIAAGCSKNYLSAIERGVNKLTVPLLLEYCLALDKTPNEVLGYEDSGKRANPALMDVVTSLEEGKTKLAVKLLRALQEQ